VFILLMGSPMTPTPTPTTTPLPYSQYPCTLASHGSGHFSLPSARPSVVLSTPRQPNSSQKLLPELI
ncbi:hypothetical protein FOZ63_025064, partial [Perkinsus olseni]